MAHFSKIGENNIVLDTVVVDNSVITDGDGVEHEQLGINFLTSLFPETVWIQTSYNGTFRKQYAYPGYTYNVEKDIFIAPQPYPSWILDENDDWQPPIPFPENGIGLWWSEEEVNWVAIPGWQASPSPDDAEVAENFAD